MVETERVRHRRRAEPGRAGAAGRRMLGTVRGCVFAGLSLVVALFRLAAPALAAEPSALGASTEVRPHPVSREVIAIYDSRYEKMPSDTRIHKFAEMPLNYLGFKLTYVDVNAPLPAVDTLAHARGLVTWLVEPMRRAGAYLDWLDAATAAGLRLAALSEIAPQGDRRNDSARRRILGRLGLEDMGDYVTVTHKAHVVSLDPAMIGFERALDKALPSFSVLHAQSGGTGSGGGAGGGSVSGGDVRVHLSLTAPLRDTSVTADVVTTNHAGGYIADEFAYVFDANTDRLRWIVNPFRFFKLALGSERFPVPDVTTLDGRRLYFSHIDGDGWNNVSEIESFRATETICAEVIARTAIEPYPDLPVTVGLIAGDADTRLGGIPQAAVAAKHLFALPQVEVASHTYTHPFDWQFFESYDRRLELDKIDQVQRPGANVLDRLRLAALGLAGKQPTSERFNRYIAGSADLPRSYLRFPFDLDQEIRGALAVSTKLAPAGKTARMLLWSGDTAPYEAAVRATREAGVRNMNGGDTRLDPEYPSVFYVPPIGRPVGRERQIYAANSNENTYTGNWRGPFWGMINLDKTLAATEAPRRLKPFNLYYHMYMGEKSASLATLRHFLDLARAAEVIPVEASRYAAIAESFFDVEIEQTGVRSWSVANRSALQTVRFDEADDLAIDLGASRGVLGSRRVNGALYVALDPAVETALVVAMARTGTAQSVSAPSDPAAGPEDASAGPHISLLSSRWALAARTGEGCNLRFEAQGFGPGDMTFEGAGRQTFEVTAERGGTVLARLSARPDASGRLSFSLKSAAIEPLTVRMACHD